MSKILLPALVMSLLMANRVCGREASPPFAPQYKIDPAQTSRLTPADIVGPDNIVYPDWRYAGVPDGIPQVADVANVEDFGARADDGLDDSAAIQKAVYAAEKSGGAVVLGSGTYHLHEPIVVTGDNVVVRGQGIDTTHVVFEYVPSQVRFYRPQMGETISPDSWIEVHADPTQKIRNIHLEVNGKPLATSPVYRNVEANFVLRTTGEALVDALGPGDHTIKAVVEWRNDSRAEVTREVHIDPDYRIPAGQRRYPVHAKASVAAFLFVGDKQSGETWKLAQDGKRGDLHLTLQVAPNLKSGDAVLLMAPNTKRWRAMLDTNCDKPDCRRYQFQVDRVEGNVVHLNQPLRIDYPVEDGSFLQQIYPIRRCGVERFSIEQTKRIWTCGVLFLNAWECWAKEIKVTKAGRHPIYARYAKWCEVRDSQFDDAWFKGGAGTAYVGWERAYDCLMDNVETKGLRHAPCLQWAASGNVIRNSRFTKSDAQWHAGWTSENLLEQCVVDAHGGKGSYGHGAFGTGPDDTTHGPNGPRNVVYNCDIAAPLSGIKMNGMNENWLLLHNRIRAGKGPGIIARKGSFDHILRNNVIVLEQPDQPGILLETASCVGVELEGNCVYGQGALLTSGRAEPMSSRDNELLPANPTADRPQATPESIFEWQRGESGTALRNYAPRQ